MNFLTATVEIETDDSKLNAQLAKVKQRVTRSVSDIERYFKKNVTHSFRLITNADKLLKRLDKMHSISSTLAWYSKKFGSNLKKVHNTTARATSVMTSLSGETIKISHALSGWNLRLVDFRRRLKWNLALLTKIGSITKSIAVTFAKPFVWFSKKMYAGFRETKHFGKVIKGIEKDIKKINEGFKVWSISDILLHPIKALKAVKENLTEGAGAIDIAAESMEKFSIATKGVHDNLERINQELIATETMADRTNKALREAADGLFGGPKMYMVLFGVPGMFTAIYDAAKWAFSGILDITTSVYHKIFDMSIWVKTGVLAAFVGMYYKITQAAMDAEDALSFDELGATRTSLQRLKEAISGVLAALGKPFLSSIRAVSTAIAEWLERSTPKIAEWAEKWIKKLQVLEYAFFDWITFLITDFRGGVTVALQVVSELFKGFADALIILMDFAGRRAGKALVDAFQGVVINFLPNVVEEVNKSLKWLSQKIMKSSEQAARSMERLTGIPSGQPRGVRLGAREPTEAESASAAILRVYRERAENIKKILEGMPTWGSTEVKAAKKAEPILKKVYSAMEEHRIKMLESSGALSDMQWRNDIERARIRMDFSKEQMKSIDEMMSALDFEYNLIGKGNEARERALGLARMQVEVNELLRMDGETELEFLARRDEIMDEYSEKLERNLTLLRETNDEIDKSLTGWAAVGDAISIWINQAENWGKKLGKILTNAFDTMADGLADALMGMEMDWKAFGRMFIKQILAMIIQMQMLFVWQMLTGTVGTGAGGSVGPAAPSTGGAGIGGMEFAGLGFQHGGEVTKTGLAKVHKGEVFSGVNNEMGFGGITVNNYLGDIVDVEVMDEERVINITRKTSIQMAALDGEYRQAHNI